MNPTPRLFRQLLLLSLLIGFAQWCVSSMLPDSLPNLVSIADKNATAEMAKSFASRMHPTWAVPLAFAGIICVATFIGSMIGSFIGIFLFKWWARPLSLAITVISMLVSAFSNYVLMPGFEWAFAQAQMLLWGVILSMAYFSPVSQYFARNPR
jgi:hypothetical protein